MAEDSASRDRSVVPGGRFPSRWPWLALRLVASAFLAYVATGMAGLPEGYWAVIAAVVVDQSDLTATGRAGREGVLGIGLGALASAAIIAADDAGYPALLLFWVALVPLAALTALRPALRLSCVTLAVLILVPAPSTWERPFDRVVEIVIGTVVALALAAIVPTVRAASPE